MDGKELKLCFFLLFLYSPFSASVNLGEMLRDKEISLQQNSGRGLEDVLLDLSVQPPESSPVKSASSKPSAVKSASSKPSAVKSASSKPSAVKSASSKPSPVKSVSSKPSLVKSASSKLSPSKSAQSKGGDYPEQDLKIINRKVESDFAKLTSGIVVNPTNTLLVGGKTVWKIEKGTNLYNVLSDWALKAGWTLVWNSNLNYNIVTSVTFSGDFVSAVKQLFSSAGMKYAKLNIKFYRGNKVLLVVSDSFL